MRPVASPLFQGLSAEEWAALEQSGCLRTKSYPRHAVIFHAGEQVHALGVVLRGTVHIENDTALSESTDGCTGNI